MAIFVLDRCKESATHVLSHPIGGSPAFTLAGAAAGFRTFSQAMGVPSTGDFPRYNDYSIHYVAEQGLNFEIGVGQLVQYESGGPICLERYSSAGWVSASSNNNTIVDFPSGDGPISVYSAITAAAFNRRSPKNVQNADGDILGGNQNTMAGTGSTIVSGFSNSTNGGYNFVGGGVGNNTYGSYSTITSGFGNSAGGSYSTIPGGSGASTNMDGALVYGFANGGNAQMGWWGAKCFVNGSSFITLNSTARAATNQLAIRNNTTVYFEGFVVARGDISNYSVIWKVSGAASKNATAITTVLLGTPTVTQIYMAPNIADAALSVSADTDNGAISFSMTRGTGVNYFVVHAVIKFVEVTF